MLKHVSYRSSSSLGRPSDFASCRNASAVPTSENLKENPLNSSKCSFSTSSPLKTCSLNPKDTSCKEDFDQGFEDMSLPCFRTPDTISLTSAMSFSSLSHGKYNSLESRHFSSLQHSEKSLSLTKYPSRCNSIISLNDHHADTIPVKVYLNRLRSDMEYKILSLSTQTTCRDLILYLLAKFRLRHRDPNLFYVDMEVTVDSPADGNPVKRHLVLNDNDRPAELLQCRPKGNAHFSIGLRGGGVVRVHDSALSEGSQYKSLLVSHRTSAEELIQLLLNCYNKLDNPDHFSLYETCSNPYKNRLVCPDETPVQIQAAWPSDEKRSSFAFVIRRNSNYSLSLNSKVTWRRSLDQSSTDTESELEDHHNTTRASIMSTGSNSSCSSGISSDASSTCSSSSGISSGDSFSSSPTPSPIKRIVLSHNSSAPPSVTSSPRIAHQVKAPLNAHPRLQPQEAPPQPQIAANVHSAGNNETVTVLPAGTPSTIRPPKPVPRTLFPPRIIDALCIKKIIPGSSDAKKSTSKVSSSQNDSGIVVSSPKDHHNYSPRSVELSRKSPLRVCRSMSTSASPVVSRQLSTASNGDSGVEDSETDPSTPPALPPRSSRYSSKRANIRSLSRSSVNLSLMSPLSSKSKSYHNLSFSPNDSSPSVIATSTPKPNSSSSPRRFSHEWHRPLKTLSLSLSSSGKNNVHQAASCCLKCENCFYI